MRRVFGTIGEVIDNFVRQSQNEGRTSHRSVHFEGDTFYSYDTAVARLYGDFALFNSYDYSPTTRKHLSWIRYKLDGVKIISCPNITSFSIENIEYLKRQIKFNHGRLKRANVNKPWYYSSVIDALNNYRNYLNFTQNKNKLLLKVNEKRKMELEKYREAIYKDRERRTINRCLMPKTVFKKIENKTLLPDDIFKQRNAQRRSVLLELYTYERLLKDVKHDILDTFNEYQLVLIHTPKTHSTTRNNWDNENRKWNSIEIPLPEDMAFLKMICPSTKSPFVLRVPPTTKTCKEGLAYVNQMEEKELVNIIEES